MTAKMALAIARTLRTITKQAANVAVVAQRNYCTPYKMDPNNVHTGKVQMPDFDTPSTLGHMVGEERYEEIARIQGIPDIYGYDLHPIKGDFKHPNLKCGEGTAKDPYVVLYDEDSHMVECYCFPALEELLVTTVHVGEKKRCKCGFWWTLENVDAH